MPGTITHGRCRVTINDIVSTCKPCASPSVITVNAIFSFKFLSFLQLELNILNKEFSFELGHEFRPKPRKYIEVVLWPESFCNKAAQREKKSVSMLLSPRSCPSFISVLWVFQDKLPFIINSNFGWTQFLLSYVFSEMKSQTSVN